MPVLPIAARDNFATNTPLFELDPMTSAFLGILSPYIGAVFMETWLYGIYSILFCICTYVLLRKNKRLHWVLFCFAVLMFALASADIAYTYYLVFGRLLNGQLTFEALYPKYVMFVTNGVLADTLLMYRCFIVWGRKKRVIFGPFLLLIATAVCGYLFEGAAKNLFRHAWVYLAMTFALNVILTILTAGRIWYLRRKTRVMIGDGLLQRYNATITILIESGVLYSTYMILDLAFQNDPSASTILDAGLIQVVGIMPTLIIVQVGLGRTLQEHERGGAEPVGSLSLSSSYRRASSGSNLNKPFAMSLGSMAGASKTFVVNAPAGDHSNQYQHLQQKGAGSYRDRTLSESTTNTTRSQSYRLPEVSEAEREALNSLTAPQKRQMLLDMCNDKFTSPYISRRVSANTGVPQTSPTLPTPPSPSVASHRHRRGRTASRSTTTPWSPVDSKPSSPAPPSVPSPTTKPRSLNLNMNRSDEALSSNSATARTMIIPRSKTEALLQERKNRRSGASLIDEEMTIILPAAEGRGMDSRDSLMSENSM